MKIVLGGDHSSNEVRETIVEFLEKKGIEVHHIGSFGETSNYAEIGIEVGEKLFSEKADFGIVVCGTGIGISIAANKVKGVRCALVYEPINANITREHNDANVLVLSARCTTIEKNLEIIEKFLSGEFEGGRHELRINTITEYENEH